MSEQIDRSEWPPWAEEKIVIEEPNLQWANIAEQEIKKLRGLLDPHPFLGMEHIGSTSVPNLPAKPIVDIMAKVKDFSQIDEMVSVLSENGWNHVPQTLDQREWRVYFVKAHQNKRLAHLHVVKENSVKWVEHIRFRDILRSRPDLVKEYAALKKQLAIQFINDREAYTEAKASFIQEVLKQ